MRQWDPDRPSEEERARHPRSREVAPVAVPWAPSSRGRAGVGAARALLALQRDVGNRAVAAVLAGVVPPASAAGCRAGRPTRSGQDRLHLHGPRDDQRQGGRVLRPNRAGGRAEAVQGQAHRLGQPHGGADAHRFSRRTRRLRAHCDVDVRVPLPGRPPDPARATSLRAAGTAGQPRHQARVCRLWLPKAALRARCELCGTSGESVVSRPVPLHTAAATRAGTGRARRPSRTSNWSPTWRLPPSPRILRPSLWGHAVALVVLHVATRRARPGHMLGHKRPRGAPFRLGKFDQARTTT
jgi:hypothetical protein